METNLPQPANPHPIVPIESDNLRFYVISIYVMYLLFFWSIIVPMIGVVLAYINRPRAKGTAYYSHFSSQIFVFWVGILLGAIGGLLAIILIGWLILIPLGVWFLYRCIKGLVYAFEGQAI